MEFDYKKDLEKQKVKLVKPLNYKKIIGEAHPVNLEDPEIFEKMETLGWRLVKTCVKEGGIGLAAPQIGIPLQAFVAIDFEDDWTWRFKDTFRLYLNPQFNLIRRVERLSFPENCLSVPGKTLSIKRPKVVSAIYWSFNKKGKLKEHKNVLQGNLARLFQHETQHCQGVSIVDMWERQNAKPRRGRPPGSKNKKKRGRPKGSKNKKKAGS